MNRYEDVHGLAEEIARRENYPPQSARTEDERAAILEAILTLRRNRDWIDNALRVRYSKRFRWFGPGNCGDPCDGIFLGLERARSSLEDPEP